MYRAVTHSIQISVDPKYRPDNSNPRKSEWFWSYTVEIQNLGTGSVQLLDREWRITDAQGHTQVIKGVGVAGTQPEIPAGASYTYTSGCPLRTPSGIMEGRYTMRLWNGTTFEAAIPAFSLDVPTPSRLLN